MHGGTVEMRGDFVFRAGEQRHDRKGGASQDNAGDAVLWRTASHKIAGRFVGDVNGEGEKAESNDPQCSFLVSVALFNVGIDGHPPEQHRPGKHFDKAIYPETHERNASGHHTCSDRHDPFDGIPCDGEVFEPFAAP